MLWLTNASTSGRLPIGGAVTGTLETSGDKDWFAVNLIVGLTYEFDIAALPGETNASLLDITLFNANATTLAGAGTQKTVTYTPNTSGTYYLQASGGTSTGGYTVTTTALDDYTNNASTTGTVAIGGTSSGTLESLNDSDWFAVSLSAGSSYQFRAAAVNMTNASQLDIALLNATGNNLAGSGTQQSTSYTPTISGTYFLRVASSNGTSVGTYAISAVSTSTSGGGTGATGTSVYRFFDSHFGTHFFTSSATERDTILATRPDLVSEGVGLSALNSSAAGATPVYRFFDSVHGTQFLTANAAERDTVQATRADLRYEGINFYEYANPQAGAAPVYRFFDSVYGTHFFTGSETERANIVATRPDLVQEGIAFYSPS